MVSTSPAGGAPELLEENYSFFFIEKIGLTIRCWYLHYLSVKSLSSTTPYVTCRASVEDYFQFLATMVTYSDRSGRDTLFSFSCHRFLGLEKSARTT